MGARHLVWPNYTFGPDQQLIVKQLTVELNNLIVIKQLEV